MKQYKNFYQSMIAPESLFSAWGEFHRSKGSKEDVMELEYALEQEIFALHRDLNNRIYRHGPYTGFMITDPKLRHIHKATVRDRIVHHAVFRVLYPIFEPTFIPDSFSCRIGKGTHKGIDRLQTMIRRVSKNGTHPCYALKCDIQKFFDSVDHRILLSILQRRITDPDALWLLQEIIGSYVAEGTRERERERESTRRCSKRNPHWEPDQPDIREYLHE